MSPEAPAYVRRGDLREKVAAVIGVLLPAAAVWSLLSIPLAGWDPSWMITFVLICLGLPAGPSLFNVVVLLALTGPIRRRFRAAHTLLAVLMGLTLVSTVAELLLRGFSSAADWYWVDTLFTVEAVTVALALALVVWARPRFGVRLAGHARSRAFAVLLIGLTLSFLVTLTLVWCFPDNLGSGSQRALWSLKAVLGDHITGEDAVLAGRHGPRWLYTLGGLLSAAAVLAAARVLWRAERRSVMTTADQEIGLRDLLLEHGEEDSLGYFATRRDKSVMFTPCGTAAIAYRSQGNLSLASGDPIGDPEDWPAVIDAWLAATAGEGRFPMVLAASERSARLYADRGLKVFMMGDEAVLHAEGFSLSGRAMRPVRQAVNRVQRAGCTAQVRRFADLTPDEVAEVEELATAWRGEDAERGFSMALGRFSDPSDAQNVLVTAHNSAGVIVGLLSFVPWGRRGLSLDLMRRSPEAVGGVNEFMVAALMHAADSLGLRRVSLNFAALRQVFHAADQVGAGPVTRAMDRVLTLMSKYYQLDTLYRFNDKYGPQWVPRLMCYDPRMTLPRAAIAMARVEGFLPGLPWADTRTEDAQPPRPEPDFVATVRERAQAVRAATPPVVRLSDQQRVRRSALAVMQAAGREGYPVAVPRDTAIAAAAAAFSAPADSAGTFGSAESAGTAGTAGTGRVLGDRVAVVGRVRALRDLGGVSFAVLEEDGARLQALVSADATPADQREDWRRFVHLGDRVSVTGELVRSRSGEPSVRVESWAMAAKCLNPLPGVHARLNEAARTRNRTLDLITHPDAMGLLKDRSAAVRALRDAFTEEGFTEVETPILQTVHGGAAARPFVTQINAYDMELSLRIAPELFLKRLMVAGMERVFEVGRNFRNEGADATHNPEFTAVEAYAAFEDYVSMRERTRRVILAMARAVHGREIALRPDGEGGYTEVDLSGEWPVVTLHEAVGRAVGRPVDATTPAAELAALCEQYEVAVPDGLSAGHLVMELYEALVEKQTERPTFYCDFPVEVSPLARPHRTVPGLTEQWDLVAFGAELGTAYSELIDPVDQRDRLTRQSMAAAAGDLEAMELDEDFLDALSYGMPPTGGLGIGVDRVVMMLTGQNIRATLTFPFVKPVS